MSGLFSAIIPAADVDYSHRAPFQLQLLSNFVYAVQCEDVLQREKKRKKKRFSFEAISAVWTSPWCCCDLLPNESTFPQLEGSSPCCCDALIRPFAFMFLTISLGKKTMVNNFHAAVKPRPPSLWEQKLGGSPVLTPSSRFLFIYFLKVASESPSVCVLEWVWMHWIGNWWRHCF